jgi:hypothetical protein
VAPFGHAFLHKPLKTQARNKWRLAPIFWTFKIDTENLRGHPQRPKFPPTAVRMRCLGVAALSNPSSIGNRQPQKTSCHDINNIGKKFPQKILRYQSTLRFVVWHHSCDHDVIMTALVMAQSLKLNGYLASEEELGE